MEILEVDSDLFRTFASSWSWTRNEKPVNYQDVRGGPSGMFPPAITRSCYLSKVSFGTFRGGSFLFDMIQKNVMFHILKQLFFYLFRVKQKREIIDYYGCKMQRHQHEAKGNGKPAKDSPYVCLQSWQPPDASMG